MEGYMGVADDVVVIPKEALLYGLVQAMGGTTAYAVSTAYIAYVDTYRELPSTTAIAKIVGITRQTAAKAMKDLEDAGMDVRELGVRYLEEYA